MVAIAVDCFSKTEGFGALACAEPLQLGFYGVFGYLRLAPSISLIALSITIHIITFYLLGAVIGGLFARKK